jgi:PGF-pre-PGF domain-containing protein/PGF-CTERM protein
LALYGVEGLEIKENKISENFREGLLIYLSSNNTVENNTIQGNLVGIYLYHSNSNELTENRIYNNHGDASGIHIELSSSNKIWNNRIWNNREGLTIIRSSGNLIYNNYFNNTENVSIYESQPNAWNISKTVGKNIVGGNYLGGNYWSNPNGNGFSDKCSDADKDGICDQPFVIDENNTDQLPLSKPAPPLTPTPTPRPAVGGIGGGGAMPGVPVYITAFTTMKANEGAELTLPQSAFWETNVVSLIIMSSEDNNIRFRIEKLKELPPEIPKPEGVLALILSIEPTMSKTTDLSGSIRFGIEIDSIRAKGFDPNAVIIILLKWDGSKWIELPTNLLSSDGKYNYYEASTPSFSYFAAVIKAAPATTPAATPTPTPTPTTPPVTTPPATTPTAEKPLIPGFEAALAIAGLLAIAYLLRRRHV